MCVRTNVCIYHFAFSSSMQVGLSSLLKSAKNFSPATKLMVQRFVPFPAVGTNALEGKHAFIGDCYIPLAAASTINAVLMRNHELTEGIEVVDSQGEVVGTSLIAARKVCVTYMTCFVCTYV